MRDTPRDANYTGPGSRFCILRPELISAFCQVEAVKRLKSSSKSKGELSGATNYVKVDSAEKQIVTEADTPLETSEISDTQLLKIMLRHVTNVGILSGDAGEILLFPVSVKTQGGEKLELQVS
ncbi:hypothetical protein U1Q18_028267 [Sarracenia purpurea var. burkii]